MITTNLPQFVQQLNLLGNVEVHDSSDTIDLQLDPKVDLQEVDDLVCDALFATPLARSSDRFGWVVRLLKLDHLRGASDMHVVKRGNSFGYVLDPIG